jgi:hypothetical protein
VYLHLARTLDKQLQLLRRSGKKAELALCRHDSFEPREALYAVEAIEGSWGEEPCFGDEENIEQEDPYEAELNTKLDQSTLQKVFQIKGTELA